jgi:HupE / UreJ protein
VVWLLSFSAAQAHLIVSQRGTLNLVGDSAYMVLSLPVSAFSGIDDDGDQRLSISELRTHSASIEAQIQRGVQLVGTSGAQLLEGLMLSSSPPDDSPTAPAEQLVVMGRFAIDPQASELTFKLGLFGKNANEQTQHMTITRGPETQLLTLTPQRMQGLIFPPARALFLDQIIHGATHVFTGPDHLLFLLVVLAAGGSLRKMIVVLTCFTLGHASTLIASNLWGWTASPAIVEPAIAASIIGMVLFDRWSAAQKQSLPDWQRFALIFGFALIHGLGLAGAFSDFGLEGKYKLLSLAGFNLGIEVAQLAVSLLGCAIITAVRRLNGAAGLAVVTKTVSFAAIVVGSFWLYARVVP